MRKSIEGEKMCHSDAHNSLYISQHLEMALVCCPNVQRRNLPAIRRTIKPESHFLVLNFRRFGELLLLVVIIIQFIIARAALHSLGDGCEVVHLQKRGVWRRVEHIWAFPWRLHFDALEFDGFRMERKYFMGLLKRRVRDSTRKARLTDISMNRKAEIVIIPMMLQAKRYKRYPILQGVNSPEILLCPRAGTRERIVGIGGIGKRITDYS